MAMEGKIPPMRVARHRHKTKQFVYISNFCYILQGDLPSMLLNLVVLKGEVRVVPVGKESCQMYGPHEFWEVPIFLTKGDAGYL